MPRADRQRSDAARPGAILNADFGIPTLRGLRVGAADSVHDLRVAGLSSAEDSLVGDVAGLDLARAIQQGRYRSFL